MENEISAAAAPRPIAKAKFSGAQKLGVGAAIIVSPWFWPVALFPSLVRKTVSIASAEQTRLAGQEAAVTPAAPAVSAPAIAARPKGFVPLPIAVGVILVFLGILGRIVFG